MSPAFHKLWTQAFVRRLLPGIVVIVCLFGRVEASEFSASSASSQARDHAEICKCGNKCRGGSCCCGHQQESNPTRVRPLDGESIAVGASPCMTSAPCGESGLPSAPYSGAFGEAAATAMCGFQLQEPAGRFLPPSPRCVIPDRRASRLDKPPECPALV
jgi:hypothetical protein